ncbi:MAG: TatD family hydrolase, partial [Candidatus Thermoplasmatota archaeon]|nr:TatD family hydrolase [Candidatus Thermoplasmatota archaeon]
REGRFIEAVKEFERKGGTGILLVNLPIPSDATRPDYFDSMYAEAERLRDSLKASTHISVVLAIGPYPLTLLDLAERTGLARAEELMLKGVETAAEHISCGKADVLGEVGRPHFDVPGEVMEASNRILDACMREARNAGCAVVLHTEDPTPGMMGALALMADRAGIRRGMVVKHHCTDLVLDEENHGIFPSVTASRENVFSAASKGTRFMLETDYIDDPARPGAFMGIGTVPRRVRELSESGRCDESALWKIGFENPATLYGRDRIVQWW